ncbi:hypothetical protein ACFX2J_018507 [Malus domestica]
MSEAAKEPAINLFGKDDFGAKLRQRLGQSYRSSGTRSVVQDYGGRDCRSGPRRLLLIQLFTVRRPTEPYPAHPEARGLSRRFVINGALFR